MQIQIIPARLAEITVLGRGAHPEGAGPAHGVCAMEAAAYIAGEPWSDHPQCVCPVIGAFMRAWNDALPDDERRTALLLPLIPQTIGTRGSDALANRRATMAADWLVRVHTPAWLRPAGLTAHADTLAGLPEITDFAATPALMPALKAARKDAAAAWDAAGAAAWDALKPTVEQLQASAAELVARMCAVKE